MNINFDFMSTILKSWENRCLRVYGKATVRKKVWHLNTPHLFLPIPNQILFKQVESPI